MTQNPDLHSLHSTKAQYLNCPGFFENIVNKCDTPSKWLTSITIHNNKSYLLCYFAVGCFNKLSCVVYITPDHIVGKVWFQHQELGINLELRDGGQKAQYNSP